MYAQVQQDNKLQCEQLQELMQPADLSTLPDNAVIMQQQPAVAKQQDELYAVHLTASQTHYTAAKAAFGHSLSAKAGNHIAGELCRTRAARLLLHMPAYCIRLSVQPNFCLTT